MTRKEEQFLDKLSELLDRLEPLAEAMTLVQAKIDRDKAQPAESPVLLIVPEDEDAPWIVEAQKWMGLNEMDDQEELQAFLGINPNDQAGGLPWCAAFVDKVLEACGIKGTGSLRAADFQNWGQPCEERNGAVAVFDGHVGFVVQDGEKILGGNQGDMVRLNNLAWYKNNRKFLGYRWPSEYEV